MDTRPEIGRAEKQLSRYLRKQPGGSLRGVPPPIPSKRSRVPKTVSKTRFLALMAQGRVSVRPPRRRPYA
jgi:hypothetical protein